MDEATESSETGKPKLAEWIKFLPAILLLVALGIRLIGINWGLPNDLHNQSYHPDEQLIFLQSQRIEPVKLKFTPGFYNYGTLYLTTLRIASDVVAGYGARPDPEKPESYWAYMAACHKAGRVISAVAGSISVVFVFLLLRRFVNPLGATAGAAILAFSPSFVVHSRFQTVDVLATMLLAISLWFCVRVLDDAQPGKWALWAAVFAGLSAGTKYTGALAMVPLVVAFWLRWKADQTQSPLKSAGLAMLVFLGAFVLATPGVLLESEAFMRDLKFEMAHMSAGHGLIFEGVGSGFLYHFTNLFQGFGPIALLLAVAGLAWGAKENVRPIWVLLTFAIPYYVIIGRSEVLFVRYTFPLLVVLAVGFGWIVGIGHERKGLCMAVPILGILGLGIALQITSAFTGWMVGTDPRDLVARQMAQLPDAAQSTVGLVSDPWFYTPAFFPESATLRGQLKQQMAQMESAIPRVVRFVPENPNERFDWDLRLLSEVKPDYVVFSSFEVAPVARLSDVKGKHVEVDRFVAFHAELERLYEPSAPSNATSLRQRYATAGLVEDLAYVRPLIYLWKRRP